MTLLQLNYFLTVAEHGSLSRAAKALYISQPSLTNSMKELEKELGVTLLNRSGRGVTLTNDGAEFLPYAKEIYRNYQVVMEKYSGAGTVKKKFSVSTQHYSFAVKAFSDMVKQFDTSQYELAVKETRTLEVINDVANLRSEIGVLYLSDFNYRAIQKLLSSGDLEFCPLIDCKASVYLWKGHPLAGEKTLTLAQLADYPCLSFDQGDNSSFYLSEEILSTREYQRAIKTSDRATMLNLMVGLQGYTLCSGIIVEELNGSDYCTIPIVGEEDEDGNMELGYIKKKNLTLSQMGQSFVLAMKTILLPYADREL